MTADSCSFEHAFLARTATRIINEVKGINRVVYDVTSKLPGNHRVGVITSPELSMTPLSRMPAPVAC